MKGQFRIVSEILIFAIGIFLVIFVVQNFQSVQQPISKISLRDQLTGVSDSIATAVVKAYVSGGAASIIIRVPARVSESAYSIKITDNKLVVQSIKNPGIYVTNGLFKIGESYFNIIAEDGLTGTVEYIKVSFDGSQIKIEGV